MAQVQDPVDRRRELTGGSSPNADKFDIHFQALCSAVEQEKFEKARSILENQTHVNVNGVNADGFTLLDLAFMTGNQALLNLVVTHGGKEGAFFPSSEAVSAHLLSLTTESRKQVEKFNQLVKLTLGGAAPATTLTQVQLKECEKQLTLWQKRLAVMKKLKTGFDNSVCPHAPVEVAASVTGSASVHVRVREPEKFGNSLYTKFKIQWSRSDSFSEVVGEVEVKTIHTLEYNIENLHEGTRYFIRAAFGNPKGYGPFCASRPRSVVPSSWRSVDKVGPRIQDQAATITSLLDELLRNRSSDLADYNVEDDPDQEDGKHRKKGLLQLFQTAPKFAKSPRQGVYLTCIMYHEDKVLTTNEDTLPLIEVQEDVPSNATLNADFHWLSKICHLWPDLAKLRSDMSRLNMTSLRARLVAAGQAMQSALGTENLGLCYYKPLRHAASGAVVFSLVHHVKSPKSLVTLSLKWAPLSRAQRRLASEEEGGLLDILRASIRDQLLFHQVAGVSVGRGLHLCYLQSHTTLDSMSVVAANTSPSILPHIKIRDNPHVTSEEWSWVRRLAGGAGSTHYHASHPSHISPTTNFLIGEGEEGVGEETLAAHQRPLRPTEAQFAFGACLEAAVERMFQYLGVAEGAARGEHRIYDGEVISLGPEVAVVLLLPATDTVCSVLETNMAINLNRGDLALVPLQSWELLHLATYHRKILSLFAKLSSILELDLQLARQQQREAMSPAELDTASVTLDMLQSVSDRLEHCWAGVRWVRDVLGAARLKTAAVGVAVSALQEWYSNQPETPDDSQFSCAAPSYGHKLDTLTNWNSRERVAGGAQLSRTPTTRSDPLQFNVMNKENNEHHGQLTNLAHMRARLMSDSHGDRLPGSGPPETPGGHHSNYSSLNSIDSNDNEIMNHIYPRQGSSPEPNILQVFAAYDTGLCWT